MLPFTHQQFVLVFSIYNGALWPLQLAVHAIGFGMLALLLRPSRRHDRANLLVVAAMWIWTGIVYHIGFFSLINPAAVAFGALFVVQGVLLLRVAMNGTVAFGTARGLRRALGWTFLVYSLLLYPLLGLLSGAHYLDLPAFGVTPCPVTLTTVGLLLLASPAPRHLFIVPVAWAFVGGSAALLLRMPQDWPLLFAPIALAAVVIADHLGKRIRALPRAEAESLVDLPSVISNRLS
jgi:hypothetical protein